MFFSKRTHIHSSTHTQKRLPHSFFCLSEVNVYHSLKWLNIHEGKHCLSSVKPFGPFSPSGTACLVIPQKSGTSQCHEILPNETSCEVKSRCLTCGQLIYWDVFYFLTTTYVKTWYKAYKSPLQLVAHPNFHDLLAQHRHPSHMSFFTENTLIYLPKDTINFFSLEKHFECKHDFTGWHTSIWYDNPVISTADSVPQKQCRSVHRFSVVMLFGWKQSTETERIPATDGIYQTPFWTCHEGPGRKERIKNCQILFNWKLHSQAPYHVLPCIMFWRMCVFFFLL